VEETREQKLRVKVRKKSEKQRNLFSDPSQKVNRYILVAQQGPEISKKSPRSLCTTLRFMKACGHSGDEGERNGSISSIALRVSVYRYLKFFK
jgi:hypothetical protein